MKTPDNIPKRKTDTGDVILKYNRKLVPSFGEKWLGDKVENQRQKQEEEGSEGVRGAFGNPVLSALRRLKHWESYKTTSEFKKAVNSAKSSLQREWEKLNTSLASISSSNNKKIEYLRNLFSSYLFSLPYTKFLATVHTITDLDYENDEDLDDMNLNTQERKKYIADEVAGLMIFHYEGFEKGQPDEFPQEVIIPILEYREKWLEEQRKAMEVLNQRHLSIIKSKIFFSTAERKLPLDLSVVQERLKNIKIEVVDEITSNLTEKWGDYNDETHTIRLSTELSSLPKYHLHVLSHEIIHAISGQTEFSLEYEFSSLNQREHTRIGTRFESFRYENLNPFGREKQISLNWLNEAITESTAMELLKENESWAYKNERILLDLIISASIPREVFLAAYFENSAPSASGKHAHSKLKFLFDITNEKFGRGFLVALDVFLYTGDYKQNLLQAIKLWKEKGEAFPEYIINLWQNK